MEVKDLHTTRVAGTENVADALTKPLASKKFTYFMDKMGVVDMENLDDLDHRVDGVDGVDGVNGIHDNNSDLGSGYGD